MHYIVSVLLSALIILGSESAKADHCIDDPITKMMAKRNAEISAALDKLLAFSGDEWVLKRIGGRHKMRWTEPYCRLKSFEISARIRRSDYIAGLKHCDHVYSAASARRDTADAQKRYSINCTDAP